MVNNGLKLTREFISCLYILNNIFYLKKIDLINDLIY